MSFQKESISLNQYASCFLIPKRNFDDAVRMAYADMARRTLHYVDDVKDSKKEELKKMAVSVFAEHLQTLEDEIKKDNFEGWHKELCEKIRSIYNKDGDVLKGELSYGQAQKWVNMFLKYLYVFDISIADSENKKSVLEAISDSVGNKNITEYFHCVIDNKMLDVAKEKLELPKPTKAWSNWNKEDYKTYQKELREKLQTKNETPFYWELKNWSSIDDVNQE